jgi:membrane protease YdiL (CAAX protease family)
MDDLIASSPPAAPFPPGRDRGVVTDWPAWMAPVVLVSAFVLANIAAAVVDIPAILLGARINGGTLSPGLVNTDTFVQDAVFVACAVFFAQMGGRTVGAWQFGLRRPGTSRRATVGLIVLLNVMFLIFSLIWGAFFHVGKEDLLKQLGADKSTILLLLSGTLTCVVAPVCEELLFRGFVFTALRNWCGMFPAAVITGLAFGAFHAGSAPAADLAPLAALGFGLCLLYHRTGSLYPCIVAHSLNNSLAFGVLESWGWQIPVLMAGSLTVIGALVLVAKRAGVISAPPTLLARAPVAAASA